MKYEYLKFWIKPFIEDFHLLLKGEIWLFIKNMRHIIIAFIVISLFIFYDKRSFTYIILIISFFGSYTFSRHNEWCKCELLRPNSFGVKDVVFLDKNDKNGNKK